MVTIQPFLKWQNNLMQNGFGHWDYFAMESFCIILPEKSASPE